MRVKLTDRFVRSATTGGRKSQIFKDDEVIGFGIQVRQTGRKSFTLDWSVVATRESQTDRAEQSPFAAM